MLSPKQGLKDLRRAFAELEKRFLAPHVGNTGLGVPTGGELLDINAFVVMAHAALEGFCEAVAIWVLHKASDAWIVKKRATRALACLLLVEGDSAIERDSYQNAYDRLRLSLEGIKQSVSKAVNANNGVDLAHLRALFYPLGVDITEDPTSMSALTNLVKIRHEVAHKNRRAATVVRTASEVKGFGDECLKIAQAIVDNVTKMRL